MIPALASIFSGLGGANTSSPSNLESALNAKTNPIMANAFAVGRGASATSNPSVNDGNTASPGGNGIPPDMIILGAAAGVAVLALLILRK